ncbi:MAG: polysaccharide biosynthesis tyrosine autokinase [Rhodobacteraceae bacterium]|nr:polysaccharide biosynthesis tyrosine autokinase [Paracoccaceae bacterium]
MTPTEPSRDSFDDEIDLVQMVAVLWRGKWLIACTIALFGLGGLGYGILAEPRFRADSLLQLEEKSGQLSLPSALSDLAAEDPRSVTEIEIIRSRLVLGQAVADLHLDWHAAPLEAPIIGNAVVRHDLPLPELGPLRPFARGGAEIRLDLLEVPPAWVGEEITLIATGGENYRLALPDGNEARGQVGTTLRLPEQGFALRIGALEGARGREYRILQLSEARAITRLRDALGVAEKGRQSGILELTFTSTEPARAERILDAVMQSYLRQNVARSTAEAASSLDFIEGQLPAAERAVTEAEAALNAYRQAQQSINLELETQGLLTQVTQLENELRALAAREDEIADRYTPNHPVYRQLLTNRARLEQRLADLRAEIDALPETQRDVVNLTRDLELAQGAYLQLLNRAQELKVLKASSIGNVRIIDTARVGPVPVSPRKTRILALALVLGALLGTGLVLLRHWQNRGIGSAEEIERVGLPVFATLAQTPAARTPRRSKGALSIYAAQHPEAVLTEAFRSLRTSLHFGMLDSTSRSLALTSTAPSAGKSFVAVNLATVMALGGQKVCLVDADMRRGYLRRFFDAPRNAPGLSELLSGKATLDEVLVEGPIPGLFLLPSGRYPPNAAELLMRDSLGKLIAELDTRFDMSLFDTPPVLAVTDAAIIGSAVGTTVAVVHHGITPISELEAMTGQLKSAGVRTAGAILNGFDPRLAPAGRAEGYSYRYAYERRE